MVLLFTLFFVVIFSGAVSAANLNLTDVQSASTAVKNYTVSTGHIPGSVVVSDKNSSTASFLNTMSTYIVELNNSDNTPVKISSVNNATGPSGNATGTLQLSEYVTIANNIKNFISTNGRVPNYSSSSLGNIRYESMVYTFSKILDFYATNGRLPGSVTVINIAGIDSTSSVIVSNSLFSDVNTGKTFSSVQAAINDPTTLSGHVIQAQSGTYTENVIVNKKVTIKPVSGGSVTFEAVNPYSPVFNITASGASIQGLSISNAFNSTGINLNAVTGCNITFNNLFNNYIATGLINSKSSNILNNTFHDNLRYGIFLVNSNSTMITGNSITDGLYGINPQNSNATIQFNRFNDCSQFALVVQYNSNITATNNWWGTNTPTRISSANWVTTYYDIYNYGINSTIISNPWIILNSSANPTTTSNNSTVTADLTHNNAGADTSSSGHIPDNQVVNFSTNGIGTIISTTRTKSGKATAIFNRGTIITSGTAVITSTYDDQSITTNITIGGTITDLNTGKTFSTIQSAINDPTTLNGDTIALNSGLYTENVVVNKTLTIMPVSGAIVTVQALSSSSPVFNLTRNGIIIQGMTIKGSTNNQSAIYIHTGASNCIINDNTITNNYVGINNVLSNNTQIINNYITNYSYMGINMGTNLVYTNNTLIQNNTIITTLPGVTYGIHFGYCKNTTVIDNSIISTVGQISDSNLGINAQDSTAYINFNRISGFTYCGLRDQNSTVNYANNWWGTNTPIYFTNGNSNGDVCDPNAISNPYPYLVMKISASNPNIDPDNTCTINVDLTTDNKGNNTSTSGNLPDGIPVNFTSTLGTIINPAYTRNGKASTTFSRGINTGIATITTTLDDQNITVNISISPVTDINTGHVFSSIQAAINDATTNNGDILELISGLYNENVVVNKTLTIMPVSGADVTVQALSSSSPTFTLATTGITLQGMTITGATDLYQSGIYLTSAAPACIINGNTITNNYYGINALSNSNTIENNNITNFSKMGINLSNLRNVLIKNNNITTTLSGVTYGIHFGNCNNINIIGNSIISIVGQISDSNIGINAQASTANINFNRIAGFTYFGLIDQQNSTVNYAYNWWGTNNPIYTTDGNSNGDVCDPNAITNPYPYLVLKISPKDVGPNNSCKVTADLTQDNNGNNTSSSGSLPDGIPVNFTGTLGTITNTAYTRNGKVVATFTAGPTYGNATIRATCDDQTVSTIVGIVHIYNNRTLVSYTTIQSAINGALNGDAIIIENGTYTENITINKNLTLTSDMYTNPIINGIIIINSSGSNSVIQYFTINGNINLFANNCTIFGNILTGNGTSGITTSNSFNNIIMNNTIIANNYDGINSTNSNNTYYDNEISGCNVGIYSYNSYDAITSNDLTGNYYGIWTYNSNDTVQFNRISGNTYGLRNDLGIVNATNNWWGSNVDPSTLPADIDLVSGTVNSTPWLVLTVNTSSTNSGGKTSVTADLTHDNTGADTSSKGHIPDSIPINYNTTFGTIIGTAYTLKGKSTTILNLGTTQNETVTTTATLDNQNVSTTGLIATGVAVLNITSTAYDNSTKLPLNISCNIPLNDSVIWVSTLWKQITNINGYKADELQIIVNGVVMQDVYIYNYSNQTTDSLTFNLSYPGVSGLNMTIVDPNSNTTSILNFPGNNISRTSQITYNGTSYEGVRSFAIATTEVTPDILNYWLNQSILYQGGSLDAAYATFLTALMVEYAHDQLADNITSDYNITWSRTSPIIVSVVDSPYETYLTLECDHTMGMTVIGTPANMRSFNYITSSNISFMEEAIMNGVSGGSLNYQSYTLNGYTSVVTDIINEYVANNTSIEFFMQNNYIIEKSVKNNNEFIVLDTETGVIRDINIIDNICGAKTPYVQYVATITQGSWGSMYPDLPIIYADGNPDPVGSVIYTWDGVSKVIVASGYNADGTFPIWSDGKLTATSNINSVSFNGNMPEDTRVYGEEGLDITSLFVANQQTTVYFEVTARDSANYMGWSSLSLFQSTYINGAYQGINTTSMADFSNFLKEYPNILPTKYENVLQNDPTLYYLWNKNNVQSADNYKISKDPKEDFPHQDEITAHAATDPIGLYEVCGEIGDGLSVLLRLL